MAITVNWITGIISIPKADTTLVQTSPTEIREINLNSFRLILRDLEENPDGRPWPRTHDHFAPITISGTQLARVVNILDPYTVTFENGTYAVNFVGANTNLADKTNVNSVSIRPNNSAGLVQSSEIQFLAFGGSITIDQTNSTGRAVTGQAYPAGTEQFPIDNITDMLFILNREGFSRVEVISDLVVGATDIIDDIEFTGQNPSQTQITFTSGCSTKRSAFYDSELTGTLAGALEIRRCHIQGLAGIGGNLSETNIQDCIIEAAGLTLSTIGTQHVHIIDCRTGPPDGTVFPPINGNNNGASTTIAGHNGRLEFTNFTNSQDLNLIYNTGQARFASTCTLGVAHVEGNCEIIDNSGASFTVTDDTIISKLDLILTRIPDILSLININTEVDTALNTIIPGTPIAGSVNDILTDLDALLPASGLLANSAAVKTEIDTALTSDTQTEAYATDGSTATVVELLYMIYSALSQFTIVGSTVTCLQLDGVTTSMTHALDSSTNPTNRIRNT